MNEKRIDHFKFSTGILSRLGEELNPHPDQGIIELVRNAYDADAINCRIKLVGVSRKGGSLCITDDGGGMDYNGISNGWLLLGRSGKVRRKLTKLGRRPVGDKGLGRLAALRMGKRVTMVTRPENEPLFEHKVIIDWEEFDHVNVVEDVSLNIDFIRRSKSKNGTEITIEKLKSSISKKQVQRLARSLLLLGDPFGNPTGFKPVLEGPEYKDLQKIMRNDFFASAEYHLIGEINDKGIGSARIMDWKGKMLWTAKHEILRKRANKNRKKVYKAPACTFEFWAFNLGKKEFLPRSMGLGDLRKWLRAVGGVHFYHRGLRVYPYGDEGHDWLEMNLRRAQSPELRPSTNNSIGRVCVEDPENQLIQKTDRTGFIENETFEEISSFAQDALEFMADCRLKKREEARISKKETISRTYQATKTELHKAIKKVPESAQKEFKEIIRKYEDTRKRQVEVLKEEVQLYRTLSTVGTTFAVFAHELKNPLSRIKNMAETIEQQGRNVLKEKYTKLFQRPVGIIIRSANAIVALPTLAMRLLERDKRERKIVSVNREISEIIKMLEPFFKEAKINVKRDYLDSEISVFGSKASLQSIFVNLVTNAMNAFIYSGCKRDSRIIMFRTSVTKNTVQIHIMDNGPGIRGLTVDEIWLPGKTTTPNGTGLGLTIVRDAVVDLGGKTYAISSSEFGGAEIIVELPIAKEEL